MSVTIKDVRDALNNISSASLTDDTITQKINDGIRIVTSMGITVEVTQDPVVRAYAAWQSFIISKDYYDMLKAQDLQMRKQAEKQAELLKDNFEEELNLAEGEGYTSEPLIVERTMMIDDRPEEDDAEVGDPDTYG